MILDKLIPDWFIPDCHFYDEETDTWMWAYSEEIIQRYFEFLKVKFKPKSKHENTQRAVSTN